jgi:hypothetical protein
MVRSFFGTFDFHACLLRTIFERQQKWSVLKLSFPSPPSRVPQAFMGRDFRRRRRRSRRHHHSRVARAGARPRHGISLDSLLDASCNIRHRRRHLADHHTMVVSRTRALATIVVIALLVVGSAVAGAVAAATTAPAAPVSPEAAEAARKTAISFSFLFLFLSASSSEPSRARSAVITVTKSRADLTAKRYLCQP